jgi:ABC-type transporter Mla MlaB component
MLRITSHFTADACVLQLEGCVAGPWVPELARCWQDAKAAPGHRVLCVDLRDVCHVDDAGRALMTAMYRAGVRFVAAGFVMPELVREISRAADGERRS